MRKIILGISVLLIFLGCTDISQIKSEINSYYKENAKDPDSYEFVSIKIDTLRNDEFAEYDNINLNYGINDLKSEDYGLSKVEIKKQSDLKLELIKYNNEIIQNKDKGIHNIIAFNICRLKNGFGAYDFEKRYFIFEYKNAKHMIISSGETKGEALLNLFK